jgi:protein TonB
MTASAIRCSPVASLSLPRIGAWSASLSIHLVVIGLLLSAPMAYTLVQKALPETPTVIRFIEPKPKPIPVVEELAPPPVHHTAPTPARHVIPVVPPVENQPRTAVSEAPVDVPTAPPTAIQTATAAPPDVAPTALAYGSRTSVAYPKDSLHLREQGTVLLRVLVDADGKVVSVEVEKSSGSPRLDRAAREAVKAWSFSPARHAGIAQQAWARVPITFTLSDL